MISLFNPGWVHSLESEEEAWAKRLVRYEAAIAFRRSRRWTGRVSAWLAAARTRSGRGTAPVQPRPGRDGEPTVSLRSIVGSTDDRGIVRAVPRIRRDQWNAWVHMFAADDLRGYPALTVRPGPGGWLIGNDAADALVLALLRARSQDKVRVVVAAPAAPVSVDVTEQQADTMRECVEPCEELAS